MKNMYADTPLLHFIAKRSDVIIAVAFVVAIGMLIIPIPAFMLDILIAMNLAVSLGVLLIVLYLNKGAEFSVFPSLLLMTTIFRLSINVSSTRLILSQGSDFQGDIIRAFGDFVVQNNYVIGCIIFIILIAVQFIVIIKGATRVSEVAARFTLDALPGKQMSIDADLNAGIISDQEAMKRRKELRGEVDFYGAMDGASKFVQGDVKVGLLITFVNLIGGLLVGTLGLTLSGREMSLSEAFDVFFILTVGDGLSAQIPSLLLSTATGIIVTRSVSESSLGEDIIRQVNLKPKAIMITGAFLFLLALLPGFPKVALFMLGGLLMGYGIYVSRSIQNISNEDPAASKPKDPSEGLMNLVNIDPIEIEIGFHLVPFVDVGQGGDLLERVKLIRKTCALDLGLIVPPIRIRDNLKLNPSDYLIKIRGVEVGKASLEVKKLLAIPSVHVSKEIEGESTIEPAFQTKALWIHEEMRNQAENAGYSVVDPPSILATHLTELIKRNSSDILGRQDVKQLLDKVKENYSAVVEDALKVSNLGTIQKVLQSLLREQVSIRNIVSILETIADYGERISNIDVLIEYVRQRLAKQISQQYLDEESILRVCTLDPHLEQLLEKSLQETNDGFVSTLDVQVINQFVMLLSEKLVHVSNLGYQCVILCSSGVRPLVKKLSERALPSLVVLSYNEIAPQAKLEHLDTITLGAA